MDLLIGRIVAASVYLIAAISLIVYVLVTKRKFFLGLVFPILYVAGSYIHLIYDVQSGVPEHHDIIYFQAAQVTLGLSISVLFLTRIYFIWREKRNGN